MYVVTVAFETKPEDAPRFLERVLRQARDSLAREEGCRRFDVCTDPQDATRLFLYEIYDDRGAFDLHLSSAHFRAFDADTASWIVAKHVRAWQLA